MDSAATAHYVRPAGKTRTPAAVIFIDSESWSTTGSQYETHILRCWDACIVHRRDRRRQGQADWAAGTTAATSAATIDEWASRGEATWLYAHNVTFDLIVTGLARELVALGWELSSRFGTTAGSMWCVLHKGGRVSERRDRQIRDGQPAVRVKWAHTLTIADSCSLFPGRLQDLAPLTGIVKPLLPSGDDSETAWANRCHADTDILRTLVLSLMDWWDAHDLGPWSVSGAGLAWQTYRRTLTPRQLVIDHDPSIIAWERQAVYGGRRDVFRLGDLVPGRYGEVDFTAAYPTIAASCPLPAKVACKVNDTHRAAALKGRVPSGMLAEVTIDTDSPRWPVRACGRVFYPVGRFRTVLAAPDIKAAAEAGCLAGVHDGYLYVMTGHLRPWARQVLGWAKAGDGGTPGPVKVWAKLASRAVIGKFAQRGWRTIKWVGPPCDEWCVEETADLYDGTKGVLTGLCGQWYLSWADQRGEHERPAVLAFVEAHVRARLGAIIAGPYGGAIVQCDTDGVMVSYGQLARLAAQDGRKWHRGAEVARDAGDVVNAWSAASWPLSMREKTLYRKVTVYGPQHVVLDGRLRAAGVPASAWQAGEHTWAARLWPGITWQSGHSPPGSFNRPVQAYRVLGPYAAAWVLADGSVRPVEASAGPEGVTTLGHWKASRWAAQGDVLGPRQASWADGLWEVQADDQD